MSKIIRIIATAIPNYVKDNERLTVSVSLSPQLTMRGAHVQIGKHFREIADWPKYANFFARAIKFKIVKYDNYNRPEPIDIIKRVENKYDSLLDSKGLALWQKMFPETTPVSNWEGSAIPYKIASLLQSGDLTDRTSQALTHCIENAGIYAATRKDITGEMLASFVSELEDLKVLPIETLLTHPLLTGKNNPLLGALINELEQISMEYTNELKALMHEYSVVEISDKNLAEMNEFHKRFSAYGQHPELLRHTGWLWDYSVDIDFKTANIEPGNFKYFIAVDDSNFKLNAGNGRPTGGKYIGDALLDSIAKSKINDEDFWLSFINELDIQFPLTAIEFDTKNSNWGVQTLDGNGSIFSNFKNYVTVKNDKFSVRANLIDRNQLFQKVADTLKTTDINVGATAAQPANVASSAPVASTSDGYKANGISLVIDQLDTVVRQAIINSPIKADNKDSIITGALNEFKNTSVLYQHNIHQGYRVDVIALDEYATDENNKLLYGSLCEKSERYLSLENDGQDKTLLGSTDYCEGWVSESAQVGNNGDIFIDQELFRWNDWSLVTSLTSDHHDDDQKNTDNNLTIETATTQSSLVPLRYLWKYSFALRPSDICGNSEQAINNLINDQYKKDLESHLTGVPKPNTENIFTPPILYQRTDGMHAPRMFYYQDNPRKWHWKEQIDEAIELRNGEADKQNKNEHLTTLVIRSKFKADDNNLHYEGEDDARMIAPPRVSLAFAIQHGVLDDIMRLAVTDDERESALDEWVAKDYIEQHDKDQSDLARRVMRISKNDKIDYIYDPVVNGFEFILDNVHYDMQGDYAFVKPDKEDQSGDITPYWEDQKYHMLRLTEKTDHNSKTTSVHFLYDENNGDYETHIKLEQGATHKLFLGSKWGLNFLGRDPYNIFLSGIAKNKFVTLELVHAVEKPCLLNVYYQTKDLLKRKFVPSFCCSDNDLEKRVPGSTICVLNISFDCFPVLTSGSYALYVQYHDRVCDRTLPTGYKDVFTEKLVKSGISPLDLTVEENVVFQNMLHNMPDTKYRNANYYIEATSTYCNYFQSKGKRANSIVGFTSYIPSDVDRLQMDDHIFNVEDPDKNPGLLSLLSTAKPKDLVIEKIVPLLDWTVDSGSVERKCNTFRIYFDGDWYSTGEDEEVALFFVNEKNGFSSSDSLKFKGENEQSLSHLITQLGTDPISTAEKIEMSLHKKHFKNGKYDNDKNKVKIIELEYDKPAYSNALEDIDLNLEFVTFPIRFVSREDLNDSHSITSSSNGNSKTEEVNYNSNNYKEGRFYIDITIDNDVLKEYYSPLMRFALARYQKNSITPGDSLKYCFSKIAMTDFCPVLPYRKLTIEANKITWNVADNITRDPGVDKPNKIYLFNETSPNSETSKISETIFEKESLLFNIAISEPEEAKTWHEFEKGEVVLESSEGNWTIAEYEYHNNWQLNEVDENTNPRSEIRRRMVFLYTHSPQKMK